MDITAVFGTVVPGSNPGEGTRNSQWHHVIMRKRGYGLVVERVLAKDEIGVRFPVTAQNAWS